ncbi:MAG TPA: MFS transporter [Candidatus Eisenbacteria bacterium]|nr:MFS transporter [Candidatus Eisenbacteria bacterium]
MFAWGAVVPLVRAQEHWPALLLGAVFSATPVGYGIGTVVGGRLADRMPPRRLCWASLAFLAAGFAVAFAAPSGLTFVVAYAGVALGLGGGVSLTGGVAALARALPDRAGTVGGLASAVYAGSAVFQAPLISALAPRMGWLRALEAVGVAMALIAAALLLLMPPLPARHPDLRPAARSPLVAPAVWTGALLALCGATFGALAIVELPGEVAARRLGPALIGIAAAALAAGNAAGRLLGGLGADRVGVAGVVAAVFVIELAAGLLLFAGAGTVLLLLAALGTGLALGADAGVLSRVGADAAPHRPNAAFGLVFAGFTTGAFAGPLLGALVGLPPGWLAGAAPAAVGLGLLAVRSRLSAGRADGPGPGPGR